MAIWRGCTYPFIFSITIRASCMESETVDTTLGERLIGSPRSLIAAITLADTNNAPSKELVCLFRKQVGLRLGTPRMIMLPA